MAGILAAPEARPRPPAVGAGDFVGFPASSHPHHIRNTGAEELVYLSGGENAPVEIAEFPRLGKRMVRMAREVTVYPSAAGEPFGIKG